MEARAKPVMSSDDRADARFGGARIIAGAEWAAARFGWLESVRRDATLSDAAVALAHVLALDFANRSSGECLPSVHAIMGVRGWGKTKTKTVTAELIEAGWIVRHRGRGRGNASAYGFVTRAQIVPLKGSGSRPLKGSGSRPFSGSQKGRDRDLKGSGSRPAHYIAKPCTNHGAREDRDAVLKFWADALREKAFIPSNAITVTQATEMLGKGLITTAWQGRRLIELGLVTRAELEAADVPT